ncbi:hypothetical protein EA187_18160 [Lujinxingia sediminis]|uniref:Uncharacterized protein n=1 Tax=Lujinxingia sediminis TaxID=2480984 RepID=A0ABY0CNU3_9DELT|nr:hypothetical protein [Lujinxingia sediminis]RVU41582.1 hypothetical protein EA187_18160 [Lujinxingia sediminis]
MSQKHLAMITLAAAALSFAPGWFSSEENPCRNEPITVRHMELVELIVDGKSIDDLSAHENLELRAYDNPDYQTVHVSVTNTETGEEEVMNFAISSHLNWEEHLRTEEGGDQ